MTHLCIAGQCRSARPLTPPRDPPVWGGRSSKIGLPYITTRERSSSAFQFAFCGMVEGIDVIVLKYYRNLESSECLTMCHMFSLQSVKVLMYQPTINYEGLCIHKPQSCDIIHDPIYISEQFVFNSYSLRSSSQRNIMQNSIIYLNSLF